MPFACAVATCALNSASCVSLSDIPSTGPKLAVKSVEAIGETREVMLEKVLLRVGIGAS